MERTLTILKPDCVGKQLIGAVIDKIERAGFRIVAMKKTKLSAETAGEFYAVHRERPFYGELVEFMSSGPCVPMILEKDNAVEDFRTLIGATDPAEAAEGTIRKLYADSKGENIIHGSDSSENAALEASFFFATEEVVRVNM
ncbi:nucleoside-diphosphate kinase [Prosthecochloris sp. HL-130-GSB]|uniref:Nucleoside diphosphate kinase n=1 Tax=Prosthecochloris aestuarii TaxID=1102 RepID=A0A831SPX6_PROAE|nr:nucleoside-diphosphate kinase [Prosthecochloris sp. HL-130-GSB]ARM32000.1 nucleoside-diphosphate kinase [Prosthecochloris sp. HL-130-GSB]MBO8092995.1 nucleoside-diphosphate kinase [Prosthecochloris sp.]HED31536.1 nucleoside-diphosphate kinase [Prosthecochloris aestuarii]